MRDAVPKPIISIASLIMRFMEIAEERVFGHLLGVSASGNELANSSGEESWSYEGCQWLPVWRVLKGLGAGPSDVFVDLGSGKGKALLIAGRLPYQRVIGVEIDKEFCNYSERNVRQARNRLRAQEVNVVTANVLEWSIPDETSVIFMYNPFTSQTFHTALNRIFASYDRNPRALHIVYSYPWEHEWLLSTGRVVVDNVRPSQWPARPRWWQSGKVMVSYRVVRGGGRYEPRRAHRLLTSGQAMRRWSNPGGAGFPSQRDRDWLALLVARSRASGLQVPSFEGLDPDPGDG